MQIVLELSHSERVRSPVRAYPMGAEGVGGLQLEGGKKLIIRGRLPSLTRPRWCDDDSLTVLRSKRIFVGVTYLICPNGGRRCLRLSKADQWLPLYCNRSREPRPARRNCAI